MEIKRKIEFKERMNEKKKEEIMNKRNIQEEDIELKGVQYVEKRPHINLPVGNSPVVSKNTSNQQNRVKDNNYSPMRREKKERMDDYEVRDLALQSK